MPLLPGRFLAFSLVVLQAALALCGPGHHGLVCAAGFYGKTEVRHPIGPIVERGDGSDSIDCCPVCKHLALGQLPCEPARFTPDETLAPSEHRTPPATRLSSFAFLANPRAPPVEP